MQITILDIKLKENLTEQKIINHVIKKYNIKTLKSAKLVRKSLDLREKNNPLYIYQVVLEVNESEKHNPKLHQKKC